MDISFYEKWFAGYTAEIRSRISGASVLPPDPVLDEVDLKIEHTYRVRNHCREIAMWLGLPKRDIGLAEIIGLFHDLGRFRQALKFGTMDDRITGNHGQMSADIFLDEVSKEKLRDDEVLIISDALHYHNAFILPPALSTRSLLFTKLARDGDKLDIFRFYSDKAEKRVFRFIMSEGEGEYSPNMLEGVLRGENLRVSGIKNKNDRKLMQVSLVYDMNFGYSFERMLEKNYLAVLTGVSDGMADDTMQKVYAYATDWMRDKVGQRV